MVHNLLSFRVRCALLSEVITEIDRYRVEVSGRDEEEIFFVENLSWLGTNSRASMFLATHAAAWCLGIRARLATHHRTGDSSI